MLIVTIGEFPGDNLTLDSRGENKRLQKFFLNNIFDKFLPWSKETKDDVDEDKNVAFNVLVQNIVGMYLDTTTEEKRKTVVQSIVGPMLKRMTKKEILRCIKEIVLNIPDDGGSKDNRSGSNGGDEDDDDQQDGGGSCGGGSGGGGSGRGSGRGSGGRGSGGRDGGSALEVETGPR